MEATLETNAQDVKQCEEEEKNGGGQHTVKTKAKREDLIYLY